MTSPFPSTTPSSRLAMLLRLDLAYRLVAEFRQDEAFKRSTIQSGRSKVLCSDAQIALCDRAECVDLC